MNWKMMLAASAIAISRAGGAGAADAVIEQPPMEAVPFFTWTGGYAGLQGGYAWTNLGVDGGVFAIDDLNGGLFGGYAGYNWQSGAWVFGGEGDFNGLWNDQTFAGPFPSSVDIGTDWLASLRGRLGYAYDRALVFGTAGVGFAEATSDVNFGGGATLSGSDTFTGWTLGGGVEYAFTDNWIGRAEYRYYDFGDKDLDGPAGVGGIDLNTSTLTVGAAYKF
jgi:outer membrane immunogenic protein